MITMLSLQLIIFSYLTISMVPVQLRECQTNKTTIRLKSRAKTNFSISEYQNTVGAYHGNAWRKIGLSEKKKKQFVTALVLIKSNKSNNSLRAHIFLSYHITAVPCGINFIGFSRSNFQKLIFNRMLVLFVVRSFGWISPNILSEPEVGAYFLN